MAKQKGTEIDSTAVKPSELKQALKKAIEAKVPTLIHGSPGTGKSAIMAQVCTELGRELRDIRLPYMDAVDLNGLPYIVNGKQTFARPDLIPDNPNSEGVMFFDEINSAGEQVQVAAYQLILDGRIGNHVIQGDWARIGAGNLDSDNAVTVPMSSALANRFMHLTLLPDADEWFDWAIMAGVNPAVCAYIKLYNSSLWESPGDDKRFCTPRSWERTSDLLNSPTQVSRDLEHKMISGCIGPGEAAKFSTHLYKVRELPDFNEILAKPTTTRVPPDPAAQYALAIALAYKTTKATIGNLVKYMNRMQPEMRVLFGQAARGRDGVIGTTSPEFNEFCKSLVQYVLPASK